jgi:hypothetical protein
MAIGRFTAKDNVIVTDGENSLFVSSNPGYVQFATTSTYTLGTVVLGANSGVDIGDVDVTSVVPGTGVTNLGKANATATSSNDVGVAFMAKRDDELSTIAPTEGQWSVGHVDSKGALWTRGRSLDVTIKASGALSGSTNGTTFSVAEISSANFYLDVTASTGSTETLDVKIQGWDAVSGKYFDLVSFTQATGVTQERKNYGSDSGELLDKTLRYVATIGGTSPEFTFSLSMFGRE